MAKFVTSDILELGFVSIPSALFIDDRLSHRAIGCYCSIIHRLNALGRLDTKDLVNKSNPEEFCKRAVQELINFGWVSMIKKSNGCVEYMVNSKSLKPKIKDESKVPNFDDGLNNFDNKNLEEQEDYLDIIEYLRNISILKVGSTEVKELLKIFNKEAIREAISNMVQKYGSAIINSGQLNFDVAIVGELEIFGERALKGKKFKYIDDSKLKTQKDNHKEKAVNYKKEDSKTKSIDNSTNSKDDTDDFLKNLGLI